MDEDLSLDDIIELRRRSDPNFARDPLEKPTIFVDHRNRNQRTQRNRSEAPNIFNQRKWRPSSSSPPPPAGSIHWQPAPQRQNYGRNRYMNRRKNMAASPFPRRHIPYVDLDNMQELEDEQIIRALQAGGKRKRRPPSPCVIINLDSGDDRDTSCSRSPSQRSPSPRSPPPRSHSHLKRERTDKDHGHRKILTSTVGNPLDFRRQSMNQLGFRLLVSNLDPCVTTCDIREIFSEVGPMYDAKVIRPGTAEVVYKCLEDARNAVSQYHRRELDGQPMHCELISNQSTTVEVDVDVLHSVLFRNKKESRPLFSGKKVKHRK